MLKMLFVLFVGLKIADVTDWNWWLVATPLFAACAIDLATSTLTQGVKDGKDWAVSFVRWLN